MNVPVYLFTGFLDSGKSTFIQDTLRDINIYVSCISAINRSV